MFSVAPVQRLEEGRLYLEGRMFVTASLYSVQCPKFIPIVSNFGESTSPQNVAHSSQVQDSKDSLPASGLANGLPTYALPNREWMQVYRTKGDTHA